MSRILIVYGTTDGHTAKVAAAVAASLESEGHQAGIFSGAALTDVLDPRGFDGVVVAASVHLSAFQRPVRRWVARHAAALNRLPTLFLPVCLGILQRDDPAVRADLDRIVAKFQHSTGWQPRTVRFVAGALPYTRYGWIKRRVMRRIARKAGGGTDITRNYEYTDWKALDGIAREFSRTVTVRESAGTPT